MIQLELNGFGYKWVFHSYSKSTSNTWYILIWKIEKCKQIEKKLHEYEHILFVDFFFKKKNSKNWKKGEKGNRKTNFIFWNFKDHKKWKIGDLKKKDKHKKKTPKK